MTLQDFKKSIKENTPAIATAVIVFLLVAFYMVVVIPANEEENNRYHKSTLEEFNLQFNSTLKDFATQVDIHNLNDSIAAKADRLSKDTSRYGASDLALLKKIHSEKDVFFKKIREKLIIQSVGITSFTEDETEVVINKDIHLSLLLDDSLSTKALEDLSTIKDTTRVDKEALKRRLSGAIAFKNWIIYWPDREDRVFLNQGIEKEEFDSIKGTASRSGVLTFKFSDKRFYRQSFSLDGTGHNFILVGAISQENFNSHSQRVSLDPTFLSALIVILLLLSIPLIKPLISSKKEKLTHMDMLNCTFAIAVLAIVLVSFAFSQFLDNSYKETSQKDLLSLNNVVREGLNREFQPYYTAFRSVTAELEPNGGPQFHYDLDSMSENSTENIPPYNLFRELHRRFDPCYTTFDNFAAGLKADRDRQRHYDLSTMSKPFYKSRFQNFFSFGAEGDLVKDISSGREYGIRRNFWERDYFRVLTEDKKYKKVVSSVFSKFDNRFKFVYVERSEGTPYYLSGFAFIPRFMNLPVCNVNSGYMLCNNTGRVLFNSDTSKSLREDVYANSRENYDLLKILRDTTDREAAFEVNYNGEPHLFLVRKYVAAASSEAGIAPVHDYPLYLVSYKKMDFVNNLKIYTIINGFILSLGYALGITLLVLLYSIFFYMGNVSIFSRFHLFWLFPDNSRKKEYALLKWVNYSICAIFSVIFLLGFEHVLYLALLSGINLAFFNFVLLNQRVFLLNDWKGLATRKRSYIMEWVACITVLGYIIPYVLYRVDLPSFGLSLSLLGHFIILYLLKQNTAKAALPESKISTEQSARPSFISFFSSILSYHYILVPLMIIFSLFISEVNTVPDLQNPERYNSPMNSSTLLNPRGILKTDGKLIALLPVEPPSKRFLAEARFKSFQRNQNKHTFWSLVDRIGPAFILLFSLLASYLIISRLINYYSGRFFFFELAEAYRLGGFTPQEHIKALTDYTVILPPYSQADLKKMDALNLGPQLGDVPPDIVSNQVKAELLMASHQEASRDEYKMIWNPLSDEEKFIIHDFAMDSFVNYKNRDVLLRLMKRGFIIADPLTGRLRLMNYRFRDFVVYHVENDPQSAEVIKSEEANDRHTYSKWKLPLMIVAVSAMVMFMYLNKESFNHILLLGGSAVSAIGLIARFLNAPK